MNEGDFVKYLERTFPFSYGKGIGDDTSVVKTGGSFQLITKDILIEDVHFRLEDITLHALALKSLAVNVSDIAAMGGIPQYVYLGLGFPKHLPGDRVLEFFQGMEAGCKKWNIELAGGDYSISSEMFISITLVGKATRPVFRSGAKRGDLIGISGRTGESGAGLKLLLDGVKSHGLIDSHQNVEPHVGQGLVLSKYAHSMIDVSDGLLLDLSRVLGASKKGAHLDYNRIPVTQLLRDTCITHNWNEKELVLSGGEDYVLLFTVSKRNESKLKIENPGFEYYIIGEITANEGELRVEENGKVIPVDHLGYDHFERGK